jgi:hypothetical protein
MSAATGAIRGAALPNEREVYRWFTVALAAVVFVGFARSFFLHPMFPERAVPPERFFMLHGAVFTAWFALLVVQASLVASGRVALHRSIGVAGAVLAGLMVVVGTIGALIAAGRPGGFIGLPIPGLVFLAVPLIEIVLFAAMIAVAIAKRGDPATHKRLMIIASASLTAAAFARWPIISNYGPPAFFGASDLFLIAVAIWDLRSRGRLHPATLIGGGAVILSEPVQLLLGPTSGWQSFARWAVSLVA